jgi:hypothetical protein
MYSILRAEKRLTRTTVEMPRRFVLERGWIA